MKKIFTPFFLFAALTISKPDSLKAQVNVQDSLALVDFNNSTNVNWQTNTPVSTWFGITVTDNKVTAIDLSNFRDLAGSIPASFSNLSNLSDLNLFGANFGDSISPEIGNLTNLTRLCLSNCNLKGTIPSFLGNLVNLNFLDLSENHFKANVPSFLGNLINLTNLNLSLNDFWGNTSFLGNLTNLTSLNLGYNKFGGKIPPEFGNLVNLAYLDIDHNNLVGKIPPEFGNLIKLTYLNLSYNNLVGKIPLKLGKLINLEQLYLNNNQLTGSIPDGFQKNYFITLNLSDNQLSGNVIQLRPSWYRDGGYYSTELLLVNNKFTFAGMMYVQRYFKNSFYYGQANIPMHRNENILSVYTGGSDQLAYDTFKWYKNGELYQTKIADSTFTPTENGSYNVIVINSIAKQLRLHSDTINYVVADDLIASQINNENLLVSVYPNPAKTNATVSFNAEGRYTLTIIDLSGNILQTRTGVANKGANSIQLDVSNYASGMYLITIIDEKNRKQTLRLDKE
ncbi:MAG TPA: leucine-rich repeat domain-containing protein [Parafilimonas sp.]|nr:leucine-rich repeat domain-containing protein [Parafilimonas sp.]